MKQKIFIISYVSYPSPKDFSSLDSIRVSGLGKALEERGHEVIYLLPQVLQERAGKTFSGNIYYMLNELNAIIKENDPDIVVCEGWDLVSYIEGTNVPIVVDLYDSSLEVNPCLFPAVIKAFSKGDFFICGNQRQRAYYLNLALMSGFSPDVVEIAPIPLSFPSKMPKKKFSKKAVFISAGESISPLAIYGLMKNIKKTGKGYLKIYSDQKGGLGPYLFNGKGNPLSMVSSEELAEEYQKATVAVELSGRNWKTELGFSLRTVEFLWFGLPVIYPDWGDLASLIKGYNAGWVIDYADSREWERVHREIVHHPGRVRDFSKNAQRLVRENFTRDKTIAPLDYFCQHPYRAEKAENLVKARVDSITVKHEVVHGICEREKEFKRLKKELEEKTNRLAEVNEIKSQMDTVIRRWEEELEALKREWQSEEEGWDKERKDKIVEITRLEEERENLDTEIKKMKEEIDKRDKRTKALEEELRNYMTRKRQ